MRISFRLTFVLSARLCVAFAVYSRQLRHARMQYAASSIIKANGGRFVFSSDSDPLSTDSGFFIELYSGFGWISQGPETPWRYWTKVITDVSLDASFVTEFGFLADLKGLRRLSVNKCDFADFSVLCGLPICMLDVSYTPLRSLEGIETLTELSFLDISESDVTSLSPLRKVRSLLFLRASSRDTRLDFAQLMDSNLRGLQCMSEDQGYDQIKSLRFLRLFGTAHSLAFRELPHLEHLEADVSSRVDLAALHRLRCLRTLELRIATNAYSGFPDMPELLDFSPLAEMPNLRALRSNTINPTIRSLSQIEALDMSDCPSRFCEFVRMEPTVIRGMSSLRVVHLGRFEGTLKDLEAQYPGIAFVLRAEL